MRYSPVHTAALLLLAACGLGASAACNAESDRAPGPLGSAGRPATPSNSSEAGQAGDESLAGAGGSTEHDADDAGSAGAFEVPPPAPAAVFPDQLEVDVGCGMAEVGAELVIQNRGSLPLIIASAKTDSGFELRSAFPRTVAARASDIVTVMPPAPMSAANIGETREGTLDFVTNEHGETTHRVALRSTLFGAKIQFTDSEGMPIATALTLTHLGASSCPDTTKYRVRNAGNLTFTLLGPTFPSHFAGTTAGPTGLDVRPGAEVELQLGPVSGTGNVCSASGAVSFSGKGAFCQPIPELSVSWAATDASPAAGCTCTTAAE